jgi:glycosyltransferase involved in cell wall biosynthesis
MWIAYARRPDFIGGFHLLLNGLLAIMLARMTGARSLYFCGGGAREVLDGGIHGSNLFSKMKYPDPVLQNRLIALTQRADLFVTMGNRTISYFRNEGVETRFAAIPGGVDVPKNTNSMQGKEYDLILVGRLEEVKRIDILLSAIACLHRNELHARAVVVGAGSQEGKLKRLAKELQIDSSVSFPGYQTDVFTWLLKAKIFVLTSESEGLALALMEAMAAGLPCVVSDVGELGELVVDDVNGYLVQKLEPELFAERIAHILGKVSVYNRLASGAKRSGRQFAIEPAALTWNDILLSF